MPVTRPVTATTPVRSAAACRRRATRASDLVRLACLLALPCLSPAAGAQRLPIIRPGTLLQFTDRTGTRIVAPLAAISGDTVYLSTTLERTESAVPLTHIARLAYADGTEFHGRKGAAIGAGIGLAVAFILGRTESGEWRLFSTRDGRNTMAILGAGIGGFIGLAHRTPRWVVARGDVGLHLRSRNAVPALAFRLPLHARATR
ncbi:MAG: hypothetical protein IT355_18945 [Gemmatimonadaceae bacterium]|nr:hypothetical protein [Gemmatimonadaceae bacterium]